MKVQNTTAAEDLALDVLSKGRTYVRQGQGLHCPPMVTVSVKCSDYHFDLLSDGKWRLGSINTYGNHEFVYGHGCDASGWVCSPEVVEILNRLLFA